MNAVYAKCPECAHVWAVVELPAPIEDAARRMMAAFCPICGNDSPTTAPAAEIPTAQQENDVSKTIREPRGYFVHKAGSSRRQELPTFEEAEAEARYIQALSPDQSFIIAQEVARVVPHGR